MSIRSYFSWNKDIEFTRHKFNETRNYYLDVSSVGARFSKRAAEDFLDLLIENFVNQNIPGPDLSKKYLEWKRKKGYPEEKGFLTGNMVGSLQTFRTRAGGDPKRHGWAVGIPMTDAENVWAGTKLDWFEAGTDAKGGPRKGGPQPERPVFNATLNQFLTEKFPGLIASHFSIQHIWGK